MVRLVVVLALAVAALVAVSVAPAASGEWGQRQSARQQGEVSVLLPVSVQRALRGRATVTSGRAVLRSASAGELAAGAFPGFAYCGDDVAWVWPADAPGHDVTVTRTYAVYSANGTCGDAVVEPSPYLLVRVGLDYYIYDIGLAEVVYGPTNFADAWIELDLFGNSDSVFFVNEITFVDGGVASEPEYVLVEALGPSEIGASNVCQP